MSVFDAWLAKAEQVIDECLIQNGVNTTIITVEGTPLNRYASLKLESMVDSNSDGESVRAGN